MVTVHDFTDTVLCKKMNIQNEEDLARIENINRELKFLVIRNQNAINKVQNGSQENGDHSRES